MHELLLFGQVPASRHNQVLNILAGIAAMQPQPILEKHLIFKPNRKPGSGTQKQVGGAQDIQKSGAQAIQAQDLFYMQLVADVSEEGSKEQAGDMEDIVMVEVEGGEPSVTEPIDKATVPSGDKALTNPKATAGEWTLQFRDLPEVARQRSVTSRLINDTLITSGDPIKFMTALDYRHILLPPSTCQVLMYTPSYSYTASYFLSGHRYTHLSTSLLLYRLRVPTAPTSTQLESTSIDLSETRLLDPSGTYILQAAIRVQDGSKVETMTKGVNELLSLKETLKGCVDLEMGDRLALDTRVR